MGADMDIAQTRLSVPPLTRAAVAADAVIDDRTLSFAFSSEQPVERYFGNEILSHDSGAADLARLNDSAPLLWNHDPAEVIGVIERAWIGEDRRGYVRARFAQTARADEVRGMVADGILRNVSFGYRINEMRDRGNGDFLVTRYEPYEVSIVSIPADPTVGLGRADDDAARDVVVIREQPETATAVDSQEQEMSETTQVDVQAVASQAAEAERSRIAAITAMGEKFNQRDLARQLVDGGRSLDEARAAFMEKIEMSQKPITGREADVGLTEKEARSFSFLRAINALANPTDRAAWEAAAFEREVSEAAATKAGKAARGIFVPAEILRRDLVAGTATAGGNLVATDLLAASFIDILRNRSVAVRAGATMLTGLVGKVAIPKQTGSATAYWLAESGEPTESQQTIGQVTMQARTVGAFTEYSRQLAIQSSLDVEAMVRRDLAAVIALAIDKAAFYGTGADNQPKGIKNQTGINTVDFASATPTFAEVVQLETEVAADNADIGAMRYVMNAAMRGALKTAEKATGTAQFIWEPGNTVNGYATEVSNQIEAGDIFHGNFADLILGMWSGLDIMVDPYSGSKSGTVRVVALQDVDVAVRNAVSFCRGNNTLV